MSIKANLQRIYDHIADIESENHRTPQSVQLLAVSKTRPCEDIVEAYNAGQKAFGENYVQEAIDKMHQLNDLPIEWHFIGPIQSNKTKDIATHFDWVHSVDRIKIAQRLNDQRPEHLPPLNICIQINISEEQTKSGVLPSELSALIDAIKPMPKLTLRGLMAIPAVSDDFQEQRVIFARLKNLLTDTMDTLSMGMSNDYVAAIAEGATMIRIGTAIFGARDNKK